MAISASFSLGGCGAIDELKAAISQWLDTAKLPGGRDVFPEDDLQNATPTIPPEKIPKEEASKASKKKEKAESKVQRPQTVKLQKKPPISNSTETVRPADTEAQSAPPATLRLRSLYPEAPPPGAFSRFPR